MVKLLRQHVINDTLFEPNTVLDVTRVTPYMEGLDPQAREAIYQENVRVYGRWISRTQLLDNPPIPRPIEENQPVPRIPASIKI